VIAEEQFKTVLLEALEVGVVKGGDALVFLLMEGSLL